MRSQTPSDAHSRSAICIERTISLGSALGPEMTRSPFEELLQRGVLGALLGGLLLQGEHAILQFFQVL